MEGERERGRERAQRGEGEKRGIMVGRGGGGTHDQVARVW